MKKIYLFIFLLILIVIPNSVKALTFENGDLVTTSNVNLYIQNEYLSNLEYENLVIIKYSSQYFLLSYDTSDYFLLKDNGTYYRLRQVFTSGTYADSYVYNLSNLGTSNFSISLYNHTTSSNVSFNITEVLYTTFDLYSYTSDYLNTSLYMESNWDLSLVLYDVTFNILNGSNLVVKDLESNVITPTSSNLYSLESGNYTYSVTRVGYDNLVDIPFSVSQNTTIDVTQVSIINDFSNWFTNFFTEISSMLSILTNNVLFLIGISAILVFSIIAILLKIMKGGS